MWNSDLSNLMLSGDYEYRDFTFEIPATDFFAGRTVSFDANGFGATARTHRRLRSPLRPAGRAAASV